MKNELMTVAAATDLIQSGKALSLAGSQTALDQLPKGRWIAGTIPYFMTREGGVVDNAAHVFATELPEFDGIELAHYDAAHLADIVGRAPDNGFTLCIIPAMGDAHRRFASEAPSYPDAFLKPTVGWFAGVHLSELGQIKPKVYDGQSGQSFDDGAVVAHVRLPADKMASVEIVNIFEPDGGDVLHFEHTSFEVGSCLVNGERVNLASYLEQRGLTHGKQPLVGDYAGAHINVSFQGIDVAAGLVKLYAPVFPGVDYRLAKPLGNYAQEFEQALAKFDHQDVTFSCNCILNFLHGGLEGHAIEGLSGPATFGEIGYQMLNQTTVFLRII
jgi:hypothetical protein